MGIYCDLVDSSDEIAPPGAGRVGLSKASAHQLKNRVTDTFTAGIKTAFDATSEVDSINQLTGAPSGGTYTLTIELPTLKLEYTTAAIAYNATAATMETAIDTALAAHPGWTNGDLAVAEAGSAGLSDGACTFTASNCLEDMPVMLSIDTSSVTGIGGDQTVTRTTAGQGTRNSAQALFDMNIVSGTLHNSGEAPVGWTKPAPNGQSRPRSGLIKDLAKDASRVDGTDYVYEAVLALYPEIKNV